ncbi:MAG: ComF family protein [Bacillota bacterium]
MRTLAHAFRALLDLILPPTDTGRIVAEASEIEFGRLLSPIVTRSGVVALLPYRHRLVRAAVVEAKFNNNARARKFLAQVLQDYLASIEEESAELGQERYVVVPVPLGAARKRERGYNQVEAVAQTASVPLQPALVRIRDTRPQTSLSRRERLTNVRDAFSVHGAISPDISYILLDDVVTTGATLLAAKDALRKAGAHRIHSLALAH